jgi:hypothetical protein
MLMMYKSEKYYIEDPETSSKLVLAIMLAYGIVITVLMAVVGLIYGFSQMIGKLDL